MSRKVWKKTRKDDADLNKGKQVEKQEILFFLNIERYDRRTETNQAKG